MGLNLASALLSGATGDYFGLISALPGIGIAGRAMRIARKAEEADDAYQTARAMRQADRTVISKGERQKLGRQLRVANEMKDAADQMNNILTVVGVGSFGIDECLSHC